jgi:Ca2+/Na+ antiporter
MAIGTSAPEFFTSVIGVFISEDDIGTGTILGTAVFNLIVIPAACGFAVIIFRPKSADISAFPILRDSIFYILTIITLILCIKDNEVDWLALRLIFTIISFIELRNFFYYLLFSTDS